MRITNAMVNHFVANAHSTAKAATFDPQLKVATGRRIINPSDDLVAAERISHLDRAMGQLEVFGRTRETVRNNLEQADNIMSDVANLGTEAFELAVQLSNDSVGPEERAAAFTRLEGMLDTFVGLANHQRPDGSYLFNGIDDQNPPYNEFDQFVGSEVNRQVEMAPGIVQASTVTASDAFVDTGLDGALKGFLDAVNVDLGLGEVPNAEDIRTAVDALGESVKKIGNVRGRLGHRMASMDSADALGLDLEYQYLTERSQLRDADLATEFTNLSSSQTALQAVFETTKRFMQMNLGSFL